MTSTESNPTESTEPQGTDFQISQEPSSPEQSKPRVRSLPGSRARKPQAAAGDTPPRSRRNRKAEKNGDSGPAKESSFDAPEYVPGRISDALKGTYTQVAMMWGMFDPPCAQVLMQNAETMANSMEKWAKESPAIRGVLDKVITTSVVGEVIAAHAPIVMAIGMHHVPALRSKLGQPAGETAGSGMPGPAGNGDTDAMGNRKAA